MAQEGINYLFTGTLGLDQDSLKIFYDFNSGSDGHVTSVPIGNPEHSGQILGNSGDFFGDMGSGNFYNNAVKIANSTGIFSKESTFLITQERTGNSNGVIFSNFQGGAYKSGFLFGINDANKFYFQCQNNLNPSTKTSLNTISDKNAWGVKLEANNVSFLYYNNNTLNLEKESWSINSNVLLESDQWYIGSGVGQEGYQHYIDNFIYMDRAISDSNLTRLFSGVWNDVTSTAPSSTGFQTGQVTGYTSVLTGITGVLSQSEQFSGNITGTTTQDVFQYQALTGVILANETEIKFLQNLPQFCTNRSEQPIYFEETVAVETTGVTGIENVFSGTRDIDIVTPVYQAVFETGYISSGTILEELYNTGESFDTETEVVFAGDLSYLNSLGMRGVSYVGLDKDQQYFESLVMTGSPRRDWFNKNGAYNFSNLNFSLDSAYNSGEVNVFLDGRIQSTGGLAITGDFFDASIQISGDYYIDGLDLIFRDPVTKANKVIYDVFDSGDKQYFESGDYSSSGTLDVEVHNNLFFLTGRKLISGADYSGINSLFAPKDEVKDVSGEIRTLSIRPDQAYFDPNNMVYNGGSMFFNGIPLIYNSSYNNIIPFLRNTSISWLDGVRLNKGRRLEHGWRSDLYQGGQVLNDGLTGFFTSNTDFWG